MKTIEEVVANAREGAPRRGRPPFVVKQPVTFHVDREVDLVLKPGETLFLTAGRYRRGLAHGALGALLGFIAVLAILMAVAP